MSTLLTHSQAPYSGAPHFVLKTPLLGPFPEELTVCVFATGCFWGAEKGFWQMPGVYSTSVGYCNGAAEGPTYRSVCGGDTGHAEGVQVVFDPKRVSFNDLLQQYWTGHDPTQGDRQGEDEGTQYRSGVFYTTEEQGALARASKAAYEKALGRRITSHVEPLRQYYIAEDYHQQYLAKPGNKPWCSAEPTTVPLPPPEQWPMERPLSGPPGPRLPPAYWAKNGPHHGCALNRNFAQHVWEREHAGRDGDQTLESGRTDQEEKAAEEGTDQPGAR